MKILAIETSCDETALAIVQGNGDLLSLSFDLLGEVIHSQINTHKEYGGVYPMMAKREHVKNIIPLLESLLQKVDTDASNVTESEKKTLDEMWSTQEILLKEIFYRELELCEVFKKFVLTHKKPDIELLSVTEGPGLEPALWVGITVARALALFWNIPLIPTNHMEGHVVSVLLEKPSNVVVFPALALLISGGHTELVLMNSWNDYKLLGQTRDDAVGEAFDKVARMLDLPYPGGPQISKLAEGIRSQEHFTNQTHKTSTPQISSTIQFPRPMIHSKDFDFSFSGLKTAVLYKIRDITNKNTEQLKEETKSLIAEDFENSVTEVLLAKTKKALEETNAKTLIIGGGVIANKHIRTSFEKLITSDFSDITLLLPNHALTTDNAVMIGMAGYIKHLSSRDVSQEIKARGNLRVGE